MKTQTQDEIVTEARELLAEALGHSPERPLPELRSGISWLIAQRNALRAALEDVVPASTEGLALAAVPLRVEKAKAYGWTQPICSDCWANQNPGVKPARIQPAYRSGETCAHCGTATYSGIYTRVDPKTVDHPTLVK